MANKVNYAAVMILSIILIGTFVYMYDTVWADDHFQTLRYAENFADGCGIAYNCGTHDEGASGIMMVISIGIVYFFTHINLFFLAKFVPFLFAFATIYFLYKFFIKYIPNKIFVWAAILFIFLDVNMLVYSVLGTSNMLFLSSLFCIIVFFIEDKRWFGLPAYVFPLLFHLLVRQEAIFTLVALIIAEGVYGVLKKDQYKRKVALSLSLLLLTFLAGKIWYFGALSSPPSIRKLTSLSAITITMMIRNLINIIMAYLYMVPGFIAFFMNKKLWSEHQKITLFSVLLIGAHVLVRITILPDTTRYFNQIAILIFALAIIGYYQIYTGLEKLTSTNVLRVGLVIILILSAVYSFQQLSEIKEQLDSTPVLFAYCPAGKWINEHSTEDAIVSSVEVGCPAYYSHRQFLDTSGLTDYKFAEIWKKNSALFLEQSLNYYQLVQEDPNKIMNIPELQEYYDYFFEVSPDFVFVIHNPPSYVLMIHPKFQAEYVEVWKKTRQDNFRGYYSVFAKINSTEVLWNDI